ncbi:MAG: type I pantothenate kinase [Trueperaceae bacterium]|nr:type I pantothenate kinase [Trueperaceae bacterium]
MPISPYLEFSREEWSRLRDTTPLTLSQADLDELKGLNEEVGLAEVEEIYLPLSRLLNLYVEKAQDLFKVTDTFLGKPVEKVPFVIGMAGSVAAGKSTTARLLKELLSRWPNHPHVDLVTTDGFLLPNSELEKRKLMSRKGFPESYDQRKLLTFLYEVKSGQPSVQAPVYSHLSYDIVPGEFITVDQPDILIFEGLNVLQRNDLSAVNVSDFFDFSIYVDAAEDDLEKFYIGRFLKLKETAFQNPKSYFHHFTKLSHDEAIDMGREIWRTINLANLHENILPTRERADLILRKGQGHAAEAVYLRKI